MIEARFLECERSLTVPGLTQWDYGQILYIYGLEENSNTEVHYACRRQRDEAIITVGEWKEGALCSRIPDKLLKTGDDIQAYVYVAAPDSGETEYRISMPVRRRQKPGDYSDPPEKNLLRQIWEKLGGKADDIELEEGELQLKAGNKLIGTRIRLPSGGGSGREIELKNNGTAIVWRYTDSNEWKTLAELNDLRGKDGQTPEFEIREGHLFAIYD